MGDEVKCGCLDCGAPYGEDGWCDVVIPNEIWNRLMPNDGLLCFRCLTKRLILAGFDQVPVSINSGPYLDNKTATAKAARLEAGVVMLRDLILLSRNVERTTAFQEALRALVEEP